MRMNEPGTDALIVGVTHDPHRRHSLICDTQVNVTGRYRVRMDLWGEDHIERSERYALMMNASISQAIRDVISERVRQVETEGFDSEHDDSHDKSELVEAALNYAAAAAVTTQLGGKSYDGPPPMTDWLGVGWPWSLAWWKPGTVRRMLVKAAALLIGEIDRIDRRAKREAA